MKKLPLIACTAILLVTAGPAAAFSGAGMSAKLVVRTVKLSVTGSGVARTHTCQASQHKAPKALRTPAVVACEQPPRSEITLPSAGQSVASVLSQLG